MNEVVLILGVVILIAGAGVGAWGLFTTCSDNRLAQAFFHVPSCAFTLAVTVLGGATFFAGLLIAIWGGVGPSRPPQPQYWWPPPPGQR